VTWEALSALSTLAGSVIVAAAAVFAIVQLRETRRATMAQALIRTFDEIYSPAARESRAILYGHGPLADGQLPNAELARHLDEALAPLDRMQVMIDVGLLPPNTVLDLYGVMVIRLWRSCESLVAAERTRRGPQYRARAERLYSAALRRHDGDSVTAGVSFDS
jgi:phage terminase large subunit-like protein